MFLNIILFVLVFTGSTIAIGGNTWDNSKNSLFKKITNTGWIAIVILLLTLFISIAKEVELEKKEVADDHAMNDLAFKLKDANSKLANSEVELIKIESKLEVYKTLLTTLAVESERQVQWTLADFVNLRQNEVKTMRSPLFPGSVVKFMGFECDHLVLEYNFQTARIPRTVDSPYEVAIVGQSGQAIMWRLINDTPDIWSERCSGKVYILSTPRVRSDRSSDEEEEMNP